MGFFKDFFGRLFGGKRKCNVICCGLDNSGKTTIINHLKPKKAQAMEIVPTVGFSVEEFGKNGINFTVFDMSGQGRYRSLWEQYYRDCQAIIFVIDTNDKIRMCVVKDELETLLKHVDVGSAPILFFANKMDLPGSLTPVDCVQSLELEKLSDRAWHITATNAVLGEGIEEGVRWLSEQLSKS